MATCSSATSAGATAGGAGAVAGSTTTGTATALLRCVHVNLGVLNQSLVFCLLTRAVTGAGFACVDDPNTRSILWITFLGLAQKGTKTHIVAFLLIS